jgi:hypothetical protein
MPVEELLIKPEREINKSEINKLSTTSFLVLKKSKKEKRLRIKRYQKNE